MNKYLMQGRHIEGSVYKYHLVSDCLIIQRKSLKMSVEQGEKFANENNLQRVSSGLVAIMKSGVK